MSTQLEHKIDSLKYQPKPGKKRCHRTLVTNSGPACDCPSRANGTCQLPKGTKCYGDIPEIQYPDCLPYRKRQGKQWRTKSAAWYSEQIAGIQSRARIKLTHHRLNEVHDWTNGKCLWKTCQIAKNNAKIGIKTFTYTARQDIWELDGKLPYVEDSTLVVNGSGFMAHNEYRVVKPGYKAQANEYWCPDNCNKCSLCKERLGVTILALARHTKS